MRSIILDPLTVHAGDPMARTGAKSAKMHKFRNKLLLNQWLISLFGIDPLHEHKVRGKAARPFHVLAPSYRIADWLNDSAVDREERHFVKAVASKAPFLEEFFDWEQNKRSQVLEFVFDGQPCLGLGMAFLWDTAAVGLDGDERFTADPIPIRVGALLGCSDGEINEAMVEVCCLATTQNAHRRESWILERVQREVKSGLDLYRRRESLLGNLIFCGEAVNQIQHLTGNEAFFYQVLRHLFELNRHIAQWESGPFSLGGIAWSEESRETLDHPEYGPIRLFQCPAGISRSFSLHTKPTGGNIRIHFFPLQAKSIAYVGYVGEHLPTVKHKT